MQAIYGIIPARLDSTRFPGKLLYPLNRVSLIQRTYENAKQSQAFDEIIIATDSVDIAEAAKKFNAPVLMTGVCRNGTDRIAQTLQQNANLQKASIIVNIQGDEPFVESEVFDALIKALNSCKEASISTVITPLKDEKLWRSTSVVKCVTDAKGCALYFSRAPIPGSKQNIFPAICYKHIGLYAYRPSFLKEFSQLTPTPLQQFEDLEQLQFLELGYKIATALVTSESIGIDTPEDLIKAEHYLKSFSTQRQL